jgi:hypothetical protein
MRKGVGLMTGSGRRFCWRCAGVVAALCALLPLPAAAADLRQGSDVTVATGQTVNDDLYAAGGTLTIDGSVNGSVILAGGTITVAGSVSRDLMVAGGTVTVTGKVGGSVRAAGGNLTLNGPVEQDVVVAGGTVTVGSTATIGRDLVIAGGTASVSAPVGRNVDMGSGNLTIRNRVGGTVSGRVGQLRLEGAQVAGNLDYTSNNQVQLVNGAKVAGTITRHPAPNQGTSGVVAGFLSWLRGLIGIAALGVLFLLLLPRLSTRTIDALRAEPWASLGIGAAILVVTPIVALIVFIVGLLVGGWWLALLLLAAYVLVLALGYVVSGFLLGRLIFAQLGWGGYHDLLALLAGLLVLAAVGVIPIAGWLVSLAAVLVGAGALALVVTRGWQRRAQPAG